jgi:hypothetical protein
MIKDDLASFDRRRLVFALKDRCSSKGITKEFIITGVRVGMRGVDTFKGGKSG